MKKIKWYPSPDLLAQEGHFLLGMLCVLLPMAYFGTFLASWVGMWVGFVYMGIKEFTFDLFFEHDTVSTGWWDILWFSVGVIGAWLGLWIFIR